METEVKVENPKSPAVSMHQGQGAMMTEQHEVRTATGWVPVSDIQKGDQVIGADGKTHEVTEVVGVQGAQGSVFLRMEQAASEAVLPEIAVPLRGKTMLDPVEIHVQKRTAKDGSTVYRVHKHGDRGWYWVGEHVRAGSLAKALWSEGCTFVEL